MAHRKAWAKICRGSEIRIYPSGRVWGNTEGKMIWTNERRGIEMDQIFQRATSAGFAGLGGGGGRTPRDDDGGAKISG